MVTFACDGTIALTSTLIITNDTVLDATGREVTLDGNGSVRIFHVANGVKFTLIKVIVAKGHGDQGGGLWNDGGNVAVLMSTFVENTALGLDGTNGPAVPYKMDDVVLGGGYGQFARGGAIFNTGSLMVSNCNFRSNQAKGGAGGKGGYRNGTISLTAPVLSRGTSGSGGPGGLAGGGAIYSGTKASANIVSSFFSLNSAVGGCGGDAGQGDAIEDAQGDIADRQPASEGYGGSGGAAVGGSINNDLDVSSSNIMTLTACVLSSNSCVGGKGGRGSGGYGGTGSGGAISNDGYSSLNLSSVVFLSVNDCRFEGNLAQGGEGGDGGGAFIFVDGNPPTPSFRLGEGGYFGGTGYGGAIRNFLEAAVFQNCLFTKNEAKGGTGGQGGQSDPAVPSMDSAPSGAGGPGGLGSGGVCWLNGITSFVNCTFISDSAIGGRGGNGGNGLLDSASNRFSAPGNGGYGGNGQAGVLRESIGSAAITNCTFADYFAGGGDGGSGGNAAVPGLATGMAGMSYSKFVGPADCIMAEPGRVELVNSIVGPSQRSRITGPSQSGTNSVYRRVIDNGHNICFDRIPNFTSPTSLTYIDPMLAPLADNGGPTFTLALLPGSPAIDAGDDTACPPTDQRGVARPIGAHCDIGAFEFVPTPSVVRGPNGKVRLDFVLQPSRTNTVEASTNLVSWLSLGMVTSTTNGLIEFKDQDAASFPARFYRIR
jgi:hypothetical protein